MATLNKVFLMGRLTRDPELRYTPNGRSLCDFGVAVSRRFTTKDGEQRDETCYVDVTMWGRRAEVISEYFTKGSPIFIEGRLQLDTWETAEGRRSKLRVVAEDFQFIGGRGAEGPPEERAEPGARGSQRGRAAEEGGKRAAGPDKKARPAEPDADVHDVSDDEIPF